MLARALSLSILTRARALSLSLCLSHTQPKSIIRFHLEGLDAKFKTLLVSSNHTIEFIHNALAKKCLPQDTAGFGLCVVHLDEVLDDSAPRTLPLLSPSRARCRKLYQECSGTPTEPRTYIAREIHTELTSSVAMAANSMQLLPTCLACRCEPTRTCSNCTTRPSRKDTKSSLCSSCCRRQKSSIFHPVYVSMLRARALSLSHVLVH